MFYVFRSEGPKPHCPKPCSYLGTTISSRNIETRADSHTFYYFNLMVMLSEEKPLYTMSNLASDVGGYMGPLLGISFLDFFYSLRDAIQWNINKLEKKAKIKA